MNDPILSGPARPSSLSRRRMVGRVIGAAGAFALAPRAVIAQGTAAAPGADPALPKSAYSLIVPYPAGGGSDITARLVAPAFARTLGGDVIVENIAGATGGIAIQKVMSGPSDGRWLYQGSQNELIIPPLTSSAVRFKPEDLVIVHPVTTTRLVLVVRKSLPVDSVDSFVKLARERSAAEPLSYGSPGIGSLYHLIPERMARLIQSRFTHVPYKGAAPMMQDIIGERIDFTIMAWSTTMTAAMQANHYRVIANMSADKPPTLQQLPSVSEVGAFKTVDYASNAGYFVHKDTPAATKAALNRAIGSALASPDVIKALEADGRLVHRGLSLEQAAAMYRDELAKYQRIVKEIDFKLD